MASSAATESAGAAQTPEQRTIGRLLRRVDPHVWDALLAFVFTAAAFVLVALTPATPGWRGTDALGVVLLLAMTLPLVVLRQHPVAVFAVTGVATVVGAAYGYPSIMVGYITGAIALFVVTVKSSYLGSMFAGLAASAFLIAVYALLWWHETSSIVQGVVSWFVFSFVWVAGVAVHAYRENVAQARGQALQEQERAVQERERAELYLHDLEMHAIEAVTLERSRLARELHDVVGHTLNVVVLQAGAAQRVFDKKPAAAREALASIEAAGRQALADIERLLGILRAEESETEDLGAQPGFSQIDRLVDQVREAGLPVELEIEGEPHELPQSIDLSAYRIVQEGLTNTLKHAGRDAHAWVTIRYGADELCIEILDDGGGAAGPDGLAAPPPTLPAPPPPSSRSPVAFTGGRGLVGMRERVSLFGGTLEVGPRPQGGFRVYACLPLAGLLIRRPTPSPPTPPTGGDDS